MYSVTLTIGIFIFLRWRGIKNGGVINLVSFDLNAVTRKIESINVSGVSLREHNNYENRLTILFSRPVPQLTSSFDNLLRCVILAASIQ